MGILRLSAPHSTQSEDVWPPSESIPEGKINYTGGGESSVILWVMKGGQTDGECKRNTIELVIVVNNVFMRRKSLGL